MAKVSAVERNLKRERLNNSLADKRKKLKEVVMSKESTIEERFQAQLKLSKLPRNSAKVRQRNRCGLTGRPRGFYRKFRLSRIALRELASDGKIPGVTKSSW